MHSCTNPYEGSGQSILAHLANVGKANEERLESVVPGHTNMT